MGLVSLIVMEPGSQWPGHVRDSENIVAIGHPGEALLQRTQLTLSVLKQRGELVRVAVLACNDRADAASVSARTQIARELATAVAAGRYGRLVLSAADGTPTPLRRELLTLAGALSYVLRGASVMVRFNEATHGRQDWAPRRCLPEAASTSPVVRGGLPGSLSGSSQRVPVARGADSGRMPRTG